MGSTLSGKVGAKASEPETDSGRVAAPAAADGANMGAIARATVAGAVEGTTVCCTGLAV